MYNHQLDTFIQVADAGSFSKAAEALYISSTAVMKQINLLEESLDAQLFVRTPRGLTLTDAGKSYYQDAKYMIQYAKDARTRARNAMQGNDNIIRIGTSLMTPHQFLMDLWPHIHALLPELKWVKVRFDGHAVSVGQGGTVLCYAVAGLYEKSSPFGDKAQWLPKLKNAPTGKGYWLIFQDLASGDIVGAV